MRTKNSLINITVSCLSYAIIMVGSFVTRKLFADILGIEIVGIDGAFSNVIYALGIVELGLGVGTVYKLYKPVADKNWDQVAVILCFLRKCYVIISGITIALGLVSIYFVVMPIRESFSKIWLSQIFVLYVADVVASYLYSHKRAMFTADQKNYVNNVIHFAVQTSLFALQIAVLRIYASFEAYLICKIVCRLAENIIISYRFDKKYSFINLKTKTSMPDIEKKDLFKNMKALLFHKISGVGTTTASSLMIVYSGGIGQGGLRGNGIYSNYILIVSAITALTNELFNGVLASFGNLLNTSDRRKVYDNFNVLYFLNFLLYSFAVPSFVCLATPFITLWTGTGSAFAIETTIAITGYLYIYGMRQSIGMAKVSAGIYDQDKYLAVIGAVITLISSWLLIKPLGVSGIMLGNIIGIMAVSYWVQPYLVYNEVFRKKVTPYHCRFALYTVITAFYAFIAYALCGWLCGNFGSKDSISSFLVKNIHISPESSPFVAQIILSTLVCAIVPNVLNIILFYNTKEFKDLWAVAKSFLGKIKK